MLPRSSMTSTLLGCYQSQQYERSDMNRTNPAYSSHIGQSTTCSMLNAAQRLSRGGRRRNKAGKQFECRMPPFVSQRAGTSDGFMNVAMMNSIGSRVVGIGRGRAAHSNSQLPRTSHSGFGSIFNPKYIQTPPSTSTGHQHPISFQWNNSMIQKQSDSLFSPLSGLDASSQKGDSKIGFRQNVGQSSFATNETNSLWSIQPNKNISSVEYRHKKEKTNSNDVNDQSQVLPCRQNTHSKCAIMPSSSSIPFHINDKSHRDVKKRPHSTSEGLPRNRAHVRLENSSYKSNLVHTCINVTTMGLVQGQSMKTLRKAGRQRYDQAACCEEDSQVHHGSSSFQMKPDRISNPLPSSRTVVHDLVINATTKSNTYEKSVVSEVRKSPGSVRGSKNQDIQVRQPQWAVKTNLQVLTSNNFLSNS